jgi:hypothetical protein
MDTFDRLGITAPSAALTSLSISNYIAKPRRATGYKSNARSVARFSCDNMMMQCSLVFYCLRPTTT